MLYRKNKYFDSVKTRKEHNCSKYVHLKVNKYAKDMVYYSENDMKHVES